MKHVLIPVGFNKKVLNQRAKIHLFKNKSYVSKDALLARMKILSKLKVQDVEMDLESKKLTVKTSSGRSLMNAMLPMIRETTW